MHQARTLHNIIISHFFLNIYKENALTLEFSSTVAVVWYVVLEIKLPFIILYMVPLSSGTNNSCF
jgi:hypothetical protein